ncbi:MAG: hypothetical protein M3Y57_01145 [Acidobacteriota bacterium]|nr:hypothetical protein [Acidobacteriota bacterium]
MLNAAERAGFDVMVTGDKNLSHQQNLKKRKLALVVLATNDWNVIKQNPTPAPFIAPCRKFSDSWFRGSSGAPSRSTS